ncbi:HK97 gp10 family phage protein [Paraburkholderia aspalathi]|nr:HK97 gp10 family phage protein [Paraburkholderia aspalathi]
MVRQQNFSAQIDAWVAQTQKRMVAVFQTASQFVIEDMINRTRRDTGFLAASVKVSMDGPAPMSRPLPPGSVKNQYHHDKHYTMIIAGAEIGGTIWATYTANYAVYREYGTQGQTGDAMVRLAAQSWPEHVKRATAMAKARAGK